MTSIPKPPLIVLATDSKVPSGVGEHMLALASAISEDCRVILAFPPSEEGTLYLQRAHTNGFEVKPIGANAMFASWLGEVDATILHVHAGIGWEGHGLVDAGWKAGIPIVRTEHLPYLLTDDRQKAEHRLGVAMADRVVFVSRAAADTYREAGFAGPQFATVQNGIAIPIPGNSRHATRRSLDLAVDDALVITVARFTQQKNHRILLKAAEEICRTCPWTRFALVGDGPDRDNIQRLAVDSCIADHVMFLGERDDVPNLLIAADLFVLPSRFEGLPLAVLEAMALGLPVVATRIGGTSEALGSDYPWLVEADDASALAAAIVDALSSSEKRKTVAMANLHRFQRQFVSERMGRDTAALYKSVISDRTGAA